MQFPINLFTCSYGEFKPRMGHPVRVTVGFPKWLWYEVPSKFAPFTPQPEWLRGISKGEYEKRFYAQMAEVGERRIKQLLYAMATKNTTDALVFLCYESKLSEENWCHRTMVRDWMRENAGLDIPELGKTQAQLDAELPPGLF